MFSIQASVEYPGRPDNSDETYLVPQYSKTRTANVRHRTPCGPVMPELSQSLDSCICEHSSILLKVPGRQVLYIQCNTQGSRSPSMPRYRQYIIFTTPFSSLSIGEVRGIHTLCFHFKIPLRCEPSGCNRIVSMEILTSVILCNVVEKGSASVDFHSGGNRQEYCTCG